MPKSKKQKLASVPYARNIAYRGKQELKQSPTIEVRDTEADTTGDSENIFLANPFIQPLGLVSQGDDNYHRDGRQIVLKKICAKFALAGAPGTTTRVIFFIDNRCNGGSTFLQTDMFRSGASGVNSPFDPDKTDRYTILSDMTMLHTEASGGKKYMLIMKELKVNKVVKYTGNTSTVATVDNHVPYVMILNDGTSDVASATGGADILSTKNASWARFTDS